jgi:type III secretion protein Q
MIEEATRKLIRLVAIERRRPVGLERVGVHARCEDREIDAELFLDESACRYLAAAMREQPLEPDQAHWEDIGIRAGLLIGWVDLPGRTLAGLGLRDVVLLDECLLSRGNNLLLQLAPAIGLRCELSGGQLRVVKGVHEIMSDADDHTESAPALLDDVPVRLTFDLGEREIPLGELRTLLPGYLFNLGRDPRNTVNIRANGRVIGEGELVEIEGRVGVSVLRLGTSPAASA